MATSTDDPLSNKLLDGRYRILRRLGAGGMANVYLAEDEELGRRVAIKILNDRYASDELFVERFHREAKSAAGLSHPNIVSVYDRGEAEGSYYIAMEVIEGRSLKEVIRTQGRLPPRQAIDYARQILAALRFAHRNGIVHRDIKPHNILIGPENRLKVTDFGIARAGASQMTETGSVMGTAQYLSPEQARGASVTATSDLYSVGVVLYEMLTGSVPFTGETPVEIAVKHVNDVPEPPSAIVPRISRDLDQVVLRALAKNPIDRYQSAEDFDAELKRAAAGMPVSRETQDAATAVLSGTTAATRVLEPPRQSARARRPPPYDPYPPVPQRPRRRVLPLLLALVLLVVAAVAGWYIYTQIQDQVEEQQAELVQVPLVRGIAEQLAVDRIQEAGLVERVQRQASDEVEAGFVIRQEPPEGAEVDTGATVLIIVSSGVETIAVPEVTGLKVARAVEALEELGLEAKTVRVFSPREDGTVLAQDPAPDEQVPEGTIVTIRVSKGKGTVEVPDVVGKLVDPARLELEDAGFKVKVAFEESDEPENTVLAQNPEAGTEADNGSTVAIIAASPRETVTVPSVVGQTQADATEALQSAGFGVRVKPVETSDPSQFKVVLDQSPDGGVEAEAGATVTISVGVFVEQPPPPPEPPPPTAPPPAPPPTPPPAPPPTPPPAPPPTPPPAPPPTPPPAPPPTPPAEPPPPAPPPAAPE